MAGMETAFARDTHLPQAAEFAQRSDHLAARIFRNEKEGGNYHFRETFHPRTLLLETAQRARCSPAANRSKRKNFCVLGNEAIPGMRLFGDGVVGLLQAVCRHELPRFHQRAGLDVHHHGPETEVFFFPRSMLCRLARAVWRVEGFLTTRATKGVALAV